MPRFLLTHKVKRTYETQDEWVEDWRGLRQRARTDPCWLRSWYAASSRKLYCEWEAETIDSIRACLGPEELEKAPIEEVEEVAFLDAAWLD